jgi:hypothetical protein
MSAVEQCSTNWHLLHVVQVADNTEHVSVDLSLMRSSFEVTFNPVGVAMLFHGSHSFLFVKFL